MKDDLLVLLGGLEMYRYAAISLSGKHFYLILLVAPIWVCGLFLLEYVGLVDGFNSGHAQITLIGIPLVFIGVFLGLRIIASEISGRSLEIVYTVPGGCERVWWVKLIAAVLILIPVEILLAVGVWFFITEYPLFVLQGSLQGALFAMVLAMGMSALFRSEIGGAVATALVLVFFAFISGFGNIQRVFSPFYNPFAMFEADPEVLLEATVQNRIGYALLTLAILGLAFMRSNRREKLLSG
ncbi:MAG: hypothetical protein OXG15_13310 [Gammaproteobacteria bacterium]|nr:hypothetical protein [Gammaproteobacteria bacterium]